jgi:D-alanine-D-alanine ligase
MSSKKNIAVLAGGDSSEYHISMLSAESVAQNLDKEKYNVYIVQIRGQEWTLINDHNCGITINKNDFSFNDNGQKTTFDVIFPVIHGTPGENGLLQGYFKMLNIPIIGCDVLTSSLTFNKFYCNNFLRNFKIVNIADSILAKKNDPYSIDMIIETVGLPCFVKPDAGGSSFGVSKVKKKEEMDSALQVAFKESDSVIVESFIEGREFSCGLFKIKDKEYRLPPAEIISKNEFFDYQAKYDSEFNQEVIPAQLPEALIQKCQEITSKIYDALNCKGIVRMDFKLRNDEFWFLEVNSIPGMTNESIIPKMIRKAGMTFSDVADLLINELLEK